MSPLALQSQPRRAAARDGAPDAQRTLAAPATVAGKGLFFGQASTATLKPAPPDSGIRFVRVDRDPPIEIPAVAERVVDRPRWSALAAAEDPETTVEVVEHCLAALAGLGVDNAVVEVNNRELPAGDGSAKPFAEAILEAGLVEQPAPRRPIVVDDPIVLREGDATIAALPCAPGRCDLFFELDYSDNHNNANLGRQLFAFALHRDDFARDLAPARTFALETEAKTLLNNGLCTHLQPADALVIGADGPIDNNYRYPDEPARHKTLDLLGDLALAGRPVHARIVAFRSGHTLNQQLARALRELTPPDPASRSSGASALSIRQILRLLPHRYPMALIDRVVEMEGDRRAVGVKNVTINEPFFQGHYPGSPMMPGVLIVEAMSQLAGLALNQTLEHEGKVAVLLSLDRVKLRRPVQPGDQLVMEAKTIRANKRFGECDCKAFVEDRLVAEASVRFMMVDPEQL
ncbi:MAG: UDP-3-O-[3-hydroxymyristoyl] N-acetylglucosamine deacetylase [Planctomycetota bacterium]|nr:MAG: UDP-3-O-[3-hydroxymyristoyl] N-acetylglucosamine deacetylase [Planctomycetota bacterium]